MVFSHESYTALVAQGNLRDSYEISDFRYATNGTFNGFETDSYTDSRIDHDLSGLLLFNRSERTYDDRVPYRYQGMTGRATYGYNNKYLAEFNFGYNGSENFAPGKRYGFFPSGAIGWVISEEKFMIEITRIKRITKDFEVEGHVYAFDSTTIDLCLNVFWWAKFRSAKAGVKMHTLFDVETQIPAFIHITEAKVHDVNAMGNNYKFQFWN